jgi:hypothetical protein
MPLWCMVCCIDQPYIASSSRRRGTVPAISIPGLWDKVFKTITITIVVTAGSPQCSRALCTVNENVPACTMHNDHKDAQSQCTQHPRSTAVSKVPSFSSSFSFRPQLQPRWMLVLDLEHGGAYFSNAHAHHHNYQLSNHIATTALFYLPSVQVQC